MDMSRKEKESNAYRILVKIFIIKFKEIIFSVVLKIVSSAMVFVNIDDC